jgi:hypothetical protein
MHTGSRHGPTARAKEVTLQEQGRAHVFHNIFFMT